MQVNHSQHSWHKSQAQKNPAQAGFSRYHWYPPQQKTMQEKIAYVRVFAPLGWVIGAGEYVYNVEHDLQQAAQMRRRAAAR